MPEGEVELRVRVETALLSCAGCRAGCGSVGMGCVPWSSQEEAAWSECSDRKAARTSAERIRMGGGQKSISGDEGGVTLGVSESCDDAEFILEERETGEDGSSREEGGDGITSGIRRFTILALCMIERCRKRAMCVIQTQKTTTTAVKTIPASAFHAALPHDQNHDLIPLIP